MNVVVRVPEALRQLIIANNAGSNYIVPRKKSVLNAIILQHVTTISESNIPIINESNKLIIEIPNGKNKAYSVENCKIYYNDSIYYCHLTERGQAAIANYFNQIFKEIFHKFMIGYISAQYNQKSNKTKIMQGITEFCIYFNITITNTLLASLRKDWYRYRQRKTSTPFNLIY